MRASGFSWQMMLRPLFNLLLPISVIVFVNSVSIAPIAAKAEQEKLEEAFRTATEWGLQTGQFHELQKGNLILYVEAIEKDGQTLRNIFIQQRQGDREQVWGVYERVCLARGQKPGDIKPNVLDTWTGWSDEFDRALQNDCEQSFAQ